MKKLFKPDKIAGFTHYRKGLKALEKPSIFHISIKESGPPKGKERLTGLMIILVLHQ
jgi:hypothetical protein